MSILLGAVSNAAEIPTEGRSLAAVMLRRLFSNEFEEFFGKVSCHSAQCVLVQLVHLTFLSCSFQRSKKRF